MRVPSPQAACGSGYALNMQKTNGAACDGAFTPNEIETVDHNEHWNSAEAQKRSLANLRPWSADRQPKNPGRKKSEIDQLIRKFGRTKVPNDTQGRRFFELLVQRLFAIALRGNVDAMRLIVERMGGRAMNAHEMEAIAAAPTQVFVMLARNQQRDFSQRDGIPIRRLPGAS